MSAYSIGIDLGGTRIRAALIADDGSVVAKATAPTPAAEGPAVVLEAVADCAFAAMGGAPQVEVRSVGLCAPGPLDADKGHALSIPTLAGFDDLPIAKLLAERIGRRVELENDGIAAAFAEWRFGAGRAVRNLVYVTLSTGIGGGVVCDGRILRGRMGMAAHVGHMTIVADGVRCACGNRGCWEAYASGTALGRRARLRAAMHADTSLQTSGHPIDARAVFEAARAADALACELVAEEADFVGVGLVNLLHLFSPELIVIGGGVSSAFGALEQGIRKRIGTSAMPPFRDVPIVLSELGDDAGIVGVASLARERAVVPA